MESTRDTLVDGPVCVINDSDDEGSQTERARNKRHRLAASNREPQRKRPRREDSEQQPRDLIDLTGDEREERRTRIAYDLNTSPTSLDGVPQTPFQRPLPLGFGIPRVPIIHLLQQITGAPWGMNHFADPGHFRENDPDTFEDLSGGYWARRRKHAKDEQRRKGKKLSILNLIDDSEESEQESNDSRIKSTKDFGRISTATTTTTTTVDTRPEDPLPHDGLKNNNEKKIDDPAQLQTELGNLLRQMKCTICLSPLEDLTASVCGHVFCESCIMQAIKAQGKCPICRRPLTERSIHPLFL